MANKTITMLQIRRIIQLKADGKSKSHIARTLGIHRATLNTYLSKLSATGQSIPELLALNEEELSRQVYREHNTLQPDERLQILQRRFPGYKKELKKTGVTRQLLWQNYIDEYPDGYSYTQFCEHYRRYRTTLDATMHLQHEPGLSLQVDFAGKFLTYRDCLTGELISCPVLVCTMPYSGYTYVEALGSARQEFLFCAMNRCLEFLGGVPRTILSDNMKQYVLKNDRYEFTFSEMVDQWSVHYNTTLEVTRPGKPKDKPSVENAVYHAYLRIYALLRNEEFGSLAELNTRIRELLVQHNEKRFQKKPLSRQKLFLEDEQPQLLSLPNDPFLVRRITKAKVQKDYHVLLGEDKHLYSVPFQYIGQQTTIIYSERHVEVYRDYTRIATHNRSLRKYGHSTMEEHMPPGHLAWKEQLGWNADYFLAYARTIGNHAEEVFQQILASKDLVEQTYRSCIGLKRLAALYGHNRFENACVRAMQGNKVSYGMIKTILKNNLDRLPVIEENLFSLPVHQNIRGKHVYQ